MKLTQSLLGLMLLCLGKVAAADPQICPAIDCDCQAFSADNWRGVCAMHERAIKQECASANNMPQNYCRLHGPRATPVAVSVTFADLPALPSLSAAEVTALGERARTARWSLTEDLQATERFLTDNKLQQAHQISKILESSASQLFLLQRDWLHGVQLTASTEQVQQAAGTVAVHAEQTRKDLESFAESLLRNAAQGQAAREAKRQLGYRLLRLAATVAEYNALAQSAAGQADAAAAAWHQAAAVAEQLTNRAIANGEDTRFVRFYREQAAARWHRATFEWLQAGNADETQISFQNAGQALLNLPTSSVAGTDDDSSSATP